MVRMQGYSQALMLSWHDALMLLMMHSCVLVRMNVPLRLHNALLHKTKMNASITPNKGGINSEGGIYMKYQLDASPSRDMPCLGVSHRCPAKRFRHPKIETLPFFLRRSHNVGFEALALQSLGERVRQIWDGPVSADGVWVWSVFHCKHCTR